MSTKSRNRDRRGRRRGGPRRFDSLRRPDRPKPPCSMCSEPIQDITTALSSPTDGTAVHFECALNIVSDKLNSADGEKVIYLGKGSFAAVELQAYQRRTLKITRRLDWEKSDEKSEWRQRLRTDLK